MKKSVKKTVEYLQRYVGQEIIRTKRTSRIGDTSYICEPVILAGFSKNGEVIIRYTGVCADIFGATHEHKLPLDFTDRNWIPSSKAFRAKGNDLNKWKGKKVKRIRPAGAGDRSFMCEYDFEEAPTLISASRHHVVVKDNNYEYILGCDFASPEDWVLAE